MERRIGKLVGEAEKGMKLGTFLERALGFTKAQIRNMKYRPGGILVNGERARVNRMLEEGDEVKVLVSAPGGPDARSSDWRGSAGALAWGRVAPVPGSLEVLYEDEDVLAVWKPEGMVSHPGRGHYQDSLANRVQAYLLEKGEAFGEVRAVGRLDRDARGVMLFGKSRAAAWRLWKQKEEGLCRKDYLAVCRGVFPSKAALEFQSIDEPIMEQKGQKNKMCADPCGRRAITHYKVLEQGEDRAEVLVRIDTGRTHQIRAHMAWIGHPLEGDPIYGDGVSGRTRAELTAFRLEFRQPFTGEKIICEKNVKT